jgi:hypothetical protein
MFFFVGLLVGFNLMVRIAIGETRDIRSRGQTTSEGKLQLTMRDVAVITYRGGRFLLGSVAIGLVLDLIFDTTIGDIFG